MSEIDNEIAKERFRAEQDERSSRRSGICLHRAPQAYTKNRKVLIGKGLPKFVL